MKNWQLPVCGPALAIARRPGWSNFSDGSNSSLMTSVPPMPVPVGSPPWIMNLSITRWKIKPLYSGRLTRAFVLGSVHALRPVARSTKFLTVMRDSLSKSFNVMSPMDVEMVVYNPSGRGVFGVAGAALVAAAAFLAGALAGALVAGVCAQTARLRRD